MAKKMKKVDIKKVTKLSVSEQIAQMFLGLGVVVGTSEEYGFSEGTLVLKMDKCDVQIKLITPKAGIDRYESLVEEEDTEVANEEDTEVANEEDTEVEEEDTEVMEEKVEKPKQEEEKGC